MLALLHQEDVTHVAGATDHVVESFRNQLSLVLQQQCPRALARIKETGGLSDEDRQDLLFAMEGILADVTPPQQGD